MYIYNENGNGVKSIEAVDYAIRILFNVTIYI